MSLPFYQEGELARGSNKHSGALCKSIFGVELGIELRTVGKVWKKPKVMGLKSESIFVLTLLIHTLYVNVSNLPVGRVIVGACKREGKATTSSHARQLGTVLYSLNKTRYTSIFPSTSLVQ